MGLVAVSQKHHSHKIVCRHLVFASWPCFALRLRAASRQNSVQKCFLVSACLLPGPNTYLQPFRLKMPKRDRDTDNGVWQVADSHSEDDSAMVTHPVPTPPAGATQPDSVAARCPYPACPLCAWKVPPHQHTCYVTVYAAYKTLIKTLEEEPELTLAIKCKEG